VSDGENDSTLARRSLDGDRRAFGLLMRRHGSALAQTARSFGLPETDVDDAVQEGFVAAWRALGDYDTARPFRAWLFRIAINKIRDLQRHRRVRRFLFGAIGLDDAEPLHLGDTAPGPERQAIARGDLARTTALLQKLDGDLREAIVLTAIVGLTQGEAAIALGITDKAVEGRVGRARRKLALLLAQQGEKDLPGSKGVRRPAA
jgi:RNA polymerase sigma-70 factor (ECF subfamily)